MNGDQKRHREHLEAVANTAWDHYHSDPKMLAIFYQHVHDWVDSIAADDDPNVKATLAMELIWKLGFIAALEASENK